MKWEMGTFLISEGLHCQSGKINEECPHFRSRSCDSGDEIEVRFLNEQGSAVLIRGSEPVELQQERSGSGFIYSNGHTTIRGKGDELTLEIGRMAPIRCTAK
ncbi:MAG: MliC family protein [Steroidobacteraceae bacterium]